MSTLTFKFSERDPDNADDVPPSITDDVERAAWKQDQATFIRESDGVLNILVDYVQPTSALSLDDAVRQVAHFWPKKRSSFSIAVLAVPTYFVCQIPYDHPAHKKLADFMLAFHDRGLWIAEDASEEQRNKEQKDMWNTFQGHVMELDYVAYFDDRDEGQDHAEPPIHYANFCAFVAHLNSPAYDPVRFIYVLAKSAMLQAMTLGPTYSVEVRDARVIAAAQYIEYQVQTMFDEVIKSRQREARFDAAEAPKGCFSRLVHRKPMRDLSRPPPELEFLWSEWQDWKLMFQTAAADETHGKVCRDTAQRAADMMSLQEKIDSDRLAGL